MKTKRKCGQKLNKMIPQCLSLMSKSKVTILVRTLRKGHAKDMRHTHCLPQMAETGDCGRQGRQLSQEKVWQQNNQT